MPQNLQALITKIATDVATQIVNQQGTKIAQQEAQKAVNNALAFRNQIDKANPKSSLELATKSSVTESEYLPQSGGSIAFLEITGDVGFFNHTPVAKQTVTGSKASNAALASLMSALTAMGFVTDSTS